MRLIWYKEPKNIHIMDDSFCFLSLSFFLTQKDNNQIQNQPI